MEKERCFVKRIRECFQCEHHAHYTKVFSPHYYEEWEYCEKAERDIGKSDQVQITELVDLGYPNPIPTKYILIPTWCPLPRYLYDALGSDEEEEE